MAAKAEITWLLQSTAVHPGLARGLAPRGLLGERERLVYRGLTSARRRKEWLLGRWTAKHLLQTRSGGTPLDRLAVIAAADGAPEAWIEGDGALRPWPGVLSISHSGGVAFCAVSARGGELGADIERIAPRAASFPAAYFSPAEEALLGGAPAAQRDLLVTAVWSAKEAALKALRMGLREDTRRLTCSFAPFAEPPRTWAPLAIDYAPAGAEVPRTLRGWWRVWGDYVLALATTDAGPALPAPGPARIFSGGSGVRQGETAAAVA